MEFWIGLSVGMHLGRFIADFLGKFIDAYELLPPTTVDKIRKVAEAEEELGTIIEEVAD